MGDFPHPLSDEEKARGRATIQANRDARRRELEEGLGRRAALETAMDALVAVAGSGEGSERVSAAKEIIHQLVGRPVTEKVIQGDEERPVRIIVQSAFRDDGQGEQGESTLGA